MPNTLSYLFASEWPTRYGRALMQATNSTPVSTNVFILAKDRTARRDPLDNFNTYRNGWDIKSGHYWAVSAIVALREGWH